MKSKRTGFSEKYLIDQGFTEVNGVFYPPGKAPQQAQSVTNSSESVTKKRKTVSKEPKVDLFIRLVKEVFQLEAVPEHRFHEEKKWRFDYAILDSRIAIEVEGGVWTNGRHTRGKGFINDCEKYSEASILGWKLIRVTPDQLMSNNTLELIKKAITV